MISGGDLRRYLMLLFIVGGVFLCYLLWNQPTGPVFTFPVFATGPKKTYTTYAKIDLRWTWECQEQKCVRKEAGETDEHVSLASCSMFCGSTQLWPQPTGPVSFGGRSLRLAHDRLAFETTASEPVRSALLYSFAAFKDNVAVLAPLNYTGGGDIEKFIVHVGVTDSKTLRLSLKTDEGYKLAVRTNGAVVTATITAATFFGARHGLETLSQLVWWDEYGGTLRVLGTATVQDEPKFAYRGLMIDTARNYMPLESLKRVVVGMSANKLNALHWHVSDSQSFPLRLPSVPKLARYGAYGPELVYTPEQVKELVEFARIRGIRVIIEIDVPAHAGNGWTWGPEDGLGELAVCVNMQPWSLYCGEPPCGQLNPDNPRVYDVLEKVFRDVLALTGEDEIFHMGGDEVNLECWAYHRSKNNITVNADLNELWGNFTLLALERLKRANGGKAPKYVVLWSSNLSKRPYCTKYLNNKNVVVQSWGGSEWSETPELISAGYNIIVSHVDAWYLDCGFGRWRERGEAACDPYRTWQTMYKHQPWYNDALYRKKVLGGEACLWTEQVDRRTLDTRLWPRAAAFAERVWSDPYVDRNSMYINDDVYARISTQRDRLIGRGLAAEALWPHWCTENPGMCL